jgi:hypothetical protein
LLALFIDAAECCSRGIGPRKQVASVDSLSRD